MQQSNILRRMMGRVSIINERDAFTLLREGDTYCIRIELNSIGVKHCLI